VGLLYVELLFGQPPMWYGTFDRPSQRLNWYGELYDPNTPYGRLPDADKVFLLKCTQLQPMVRQWLVQLLQDHDMNHFLGWPAAWVLPV
jgi:hypothetical protein